MQDCNLKQMREQFQSLGIFYTPAEVAQKMKEIIGIDRPREVYDPTCGGGSLLACYDDNIEKYGQEIRPEALQIAQNCLSNFHGYCGDTLKDECPEWKDKKFHVIISNYPFSVKWEPDAEDPRFSVAPKLPPKSKADYAFILHCLHHLADDGVALIVCFPGILYRWAAEGAIRQWMVEQGYIDTVIQFQPKMFVDTSIAVSALILKKNRTETDITFWDYETNNKKTVSFEEVKANGFNLSVSQYEVNPPEKKEEIDITALGIAARAAAVKKMEQEVRFEMALEQIDSVNNNTLLLIYLMEDKLKQLKAEYLARH